MLHGLSVDVLCHAKPQSSTELPYSHYFMSWPRIATVSLVHQIWTIILDPNVFYFFSSASPKQNVMTEPHDCSAHPQH